ncbi:MAG: hypothetical protein L3K04_04290, partial [Thermoplasmata archaeon]|nr:hypothetical protein [Thermoplasmata archaeon]
MVHIKDEGSQFDAPIDVVWKYLQSQEHGGAHKSSRNHDMQVIDDHTVRVKMEQNMNGNWVKVENKITAVPPLAVLIEVTEGPMAGSKILNVYTPN